MVSYDFQAFLSLSGSLLTFFSFGSPLITSIYVFLGRPLWKLPLTLNVLYILDQAFASIISNQTILVLCHINIPLCLMLFNFSLSLSSSAELAIFRPSIAHPSKSIIKVSLSLSEGK